MIILKRTPRFTLKSWQFIPLYAAFTLLVYNQAFFTRLLGINDSPWFAVSIGITVFATLILILSLLFCTPKLTKIIAVTLTILNSIALYFMNSYNILIDKIMLLNVIRTDIYEASDVLQPKILLYLLLAGVLPAWLITRTKIVFAPAATELKQRLKLNHAAVFLAAVFIIPFRTETQHTLTERFDLRYALIPSNYIGAGIGVAKMYDELTRPFTPIAEDAKIHKYWKNDKKNLFVFVVGETARAANFSLGGYHRPTNAPLKPYLNNIIYYPEFYACGTSTAVAVPCMFSKYARTEFKEGSELNTANLLDVFKNVGYHGLWRENNTSCQDNCNRIELEEPCNQKFCQDDILLENLEQKIRNINQNTFLVLHQKGSHGPDYFNRYPTDWTAPYHPVCTDKGLMSCSRKEIINTYDNSITYTSLFLHRTIEILQKLSNEYNIVLIYASDHGESLGENGIYLHAAPYQTAPKEQKHIPAFIWIPQNTAQAFGIDLRCLRQKAGHHHSHDNLFHSFLGLGGIQTADYKSSLDIFAPCTAAKNPQALKKY